MPQFQLLLILYKSYIQKKFFFSATFQITVKLPQQNDANNANNEAIIDLLSKNRNGLFLKVLRYPPRIAVDYKKIKLFDTFPLRTNTSKRNCKQ